MTKLQNVPIVRCLKHPSYHGEYRPRRKCAVCDLLYIFVHQRRKDAEGHFGGLNHFQWLRVNLGWTCSRVRILRKAYRGLVLRCTSHPRYMGKDRPNVSCSGCKLLFALNHPKDLAARKIFNGAEALDDCRALEDACWELEAIRH